MAWVPHGFVIPIRTAGGGGFGMVRMPSVAFALTGRLYPFLDCLVSTALACEERLGNPIPTKVGFLPSWAGSLAMPGLLYCPGMEL